MGQVDQVNQPDGFALGFAVIDDDWDDQRQLLGIWELLADKLPVFRDVAQQLKFGEFVRIAFLPG